MKKVRSRKTPTSKLAGRIAGYSAAAAGAVIAGSGQANAGIVYSGPLDVTLGGVPYDLQMDGQANPELLLWVAATTQHCLMLGTSLWGVEVGQYAGATVIPLPPGVHLPYSMSFWWDIANARHVSFAMPMPFYISLHFPVGGPGGFPTVSGWAEIQRPDSTTWKLLGWAYEDQGGPILTGETGSVPEPSTLATLALGAAGVLAMRRRKKA